MFTWIETYTGRKVDFTAIDHEQISVIDIAWSLSALPRFAGQSPRLYTVAQHSIEICDVVPLNMKLEALLHDAAEAYIGDIPSPLKQFMGPQFFEIERQLNDAIAIAFNLDAGKMKAVKAWDKQALYCETKALFKAPIDDWHRAFMQDETVTHVGVSPASSRVGIFDQFLRRFTDYSRT